MEENITVKRNVPRDLFLHLLAIVTLYWSAISFTTLIWQFINKWFPDALTDRYMNGYASGLIRFSVSALIIVFPIFILVSWYLNNIYRKEAGVRDSRIRKWLIYFTLFVTSLIIIGDLVTLINTLLGGEVTARFVLKALSVIIVAGVIFGYYLNDVRRETPTGAGKYFAWGSGILVLATIIGSFFMIGSPMSARLLQYDQQKVYDLQGIQSQIVNYWQKKQALPNSLADLNDPISSFIVPIDPQSKQAYEYRITNVSALGFELCANFNKGSENSPNKSYYQGGMEINQNWNHSAGRVCFDRTIDKQLYSPLTK